MTVVRFGKEQQAAAVVAAATTNERKRSREDEVAREVVMDVDIMDDEDDDGEAPPPPRRTDTVPVVDTTTTRITPMEEEEEATAAAAEVVDEDIKRFFTAPVISKEQLEAIGPSVEKAIDKVVDFIESDLNAACAKYQDVKNAEAAAAAAKRSNMNATNDDDTTNTDTADASTRTPDATNMLNSVDPRSYQTALLNIAKKQNTIVHLGTGTGKVRRYSSGCNFCLAYYERESVKSNYNVLLISHLLFPFSPQTLIALLLIKEYAADFEKGKQTVFLVPSVALAVQQSISIAANLPYTVGKAYAATTHSEVARHKLAQCNIIVATHGACLDLLLHYGDLFQMSRWSLLILDECHNCTGNSPYVSIMKNFYHRPRTAGIDDDDNNNVDDRPRILGLTASPLINVKKNHSDAHLGKQLAQLEGIMNAKIASIDCLGLDDNDQHKKLLDKEADEKIVYFAPDTSLSTTTTTTTTNGILLPGSSGACWPDIDNDALFPLHASRRKELRQFTQLYQDLGPLPLTLYIPQLLKELVRNTYLKESAEQFASALEYLQAVISFCKHECETHCSGGRSNKLLVLEELLQQQIEDQQPLTVANAAPVGVVFVQRRITALCLKVYFNQRHKATEAGQEWPPSQAEQIVAAAFAAAEQVHNHPSQDKVIDEVAEENDQFMDADDEEDVVVEQSLREEQPLSNGHAAAEPHHQFGDAEPEDDPFFFSLPNNYCHNEPTTTTFTTPSTTATTEYMEAAARRAARNNNSGSSQSRVPIRCGALVRNPGKIFKSLRGGGDFTPDQEEDYIHREADIRGVINGLRSGDINVLVATSVVEEGVDVQSCSFVAVFDDLQNIKAYIQMKGRARQENAKFFVLKNVAPDTQSPLSLADAKALELRVRKFIRSQVRQPLSPTSSTEIDDTDEVPDECDASELELRAVRAGVYEARDGKITIQSAKSLLYRYALRQPIDSAVRTTKEALQAHLPQFDPDNVILSLPAYMGCSLRRFRLPNFCLDKAKKERQNILALMACVRLHQHGLLTNRLLPFSRGDIRNRILSLTKQVRSVAPIQGPKAKPVEKIGESMFQYELRLEGSVLDEARKILKTDGHGLAIVTLQPLENIPCYNHSHNEFGSLTCTLGAMRMVEFSSEEFELLSDFCTLLINARWKRRTKESVFRMKAEGREQDSFVGFYTVGCVDQSGKMDWQFMKLILEESKRDNDKRMNSVQSLSDADMLSKPRLWCPSYDEFSLYIAFGPSGMRCDSDFPKDNGKEEFGTYQDYFRERRNMEVPSDAPLFSCQRLWKLPSRQGSLALSKGQAVSPPDPQEWDRVADSLDSTRLPLSKRICLEARDRGR